MKLFSATALRNFATLGLEWDESSKKYLCTKKYIFVPFLGVSVIISCIFFLMYDVRTFYEYTFEFLVMSTSACNIVVLFIIYLKVNTFNSLIENSEIQVKKGK